MGSCSKVNLFSTRSLLKAAKRKSRYICKRFYSTSEISVIFLLQFLFWQKDWWKWKRLHWRISEINPFSSGLLQSRIQNPVKDLSWIFNPLMHNVPKWSDTLQKSCSKCCKIFRVYLTILGHYALKGWLTIVSDRNPLTIIVKCSIFVVWKSKELKKATESLPWVSI